MPLPDAGRSGGKDPSAPLFTEVLRHVPQILDSVPSGSAYSVACTCWPALLAVLQHGRRTEEGECEWTRHVSWNRTHVFYNLDLTREQRTVPVFRLGSSERDPWAADSGSESAPLSIALLQGLAREVKAGSQYAGELEYAGARVPVKDAAALLGAIVAAGVDTASPLKHDVRELAAVLEASERPGATRLRVTRFAVPQILSSDTGGEYLPPKVLPLQERASSLRRVLGTLAVRENALLIDMSHIEMDATTAAEVLGSLSTCRSLETLNLRGNKLDLTAARALAKTVKTSTRLRELDVSNTGLAKGGVQIVAKAVLETRTIKKLVIEGTVHGDAFAEEFVRTQGGALDTLDIRFSHISEEWRRKLLASAASLAHLESCAAEITRTVAPVVQSTTSLCALKLSSSGIGPGAVEELCAAITSHPALPLERLELPSLRKDSTGNDGLRAIASMLASSTTLREVLLRHDSKNLDGIDKGPSPGYTHIAEALSGNTTLRKIELDFVYVTADTFAKLARAVASSRLEVFEMVDARFPTNTTINIADLSKSSTLRHINIGIAYGDGEFDYDFEELGYDPGYQKLAGVVDFAAGLAHNSVLRILTLGNFNGLAEPDAFEALANALRTNTALRYLSLHDCSPRRSREALCVLAEALRHNRGLRSVELGNFRDCGDEAKKTMVQALRENNTLQFLWLRGLIFPNLHKDSRHKRGWHHSITLVKGPFPRIVLHDNP